MQVRPRAYCGLDWAEGHHDLAVVDQDGQLIAKRRITDDARGFTTLLELLAEAGDSPENPIPVAIETSRGLMVAAIRATCRAYLCDQPDGGGPLPRAALGLAQEIRPQSAGPTTTRNGPKARNTTPP